MYQKVTIKQFVGTKNCLKNSVQVPSPQKVNINHQLIINITIN